MHFMSQVLWYVSVQLWPPDGRLYGRPQAYVVHDRRLAPCSPQHAALLLLLRLSAHRALPEASHEGQGWAHRWGRGSDYFVPRCCRTKSNDYFPITFLQEVITFGN